ncbi:hypothetical protein [Kribbella solani]|uniref:Uncharacterized protein n=1 Tax=Kribbella solani TaxID=236067 RepID=A0A841DN66_9ACTN|nr:hypothetical protein [Kribbella solani]MBB5979982.1 hypothetical protein [Kribbella solani]
MAQTSGETAAAGGTVPNPLHAYLNALLKRVQAAQERLHNKQQRPAVTIANGSAWSSTTATLWAGEFSKQAAKYVAGVRALNDGVEELLRRTPATCTPEEAARWRAKLGGHGGR